MSVSVVETPTSRCRLGVGFADITPPVGIYHRFWGAAAYDTSTGVHRPLRATVLLFAPADNGEGEDLHAIVALDHCLFRDDDMRSLRAETIRVFGLPEQRVTFTFSHTHAAGNICRSRAELPGGELIGPYLDSLPGKIAEAFRGARRSLQPATLTYAAMTCNMGHHRDYRDAESNQYVCGFNPEASIDLPLNVVRATGDAGETRAVILNYPCHPTTLAWENTLISPDYVGKLREVVEESSGAPAVFLLAPCGDIGPRHGFVGDTEVADRGGRQVGHAALSVLDSMPPPGEDYHYRRPVVSGATIGRWSYAAQSSGRREQTGVFRHCRWTVPLPYKPDLPTIAQTKSELNECLAREAEARNDGDLPTAQEHRALAERQRRLLERLSPLPQGLYRLPLQLWQMGDAFWVAVEGEPYHRLQQELIGRFPDRPMIVFVLADGSRCSYLPTREAYGKQVYQSDVAVLEAGCLEAVTDAIAGRIEHLIQAGA